MLIKVLGICETNGHPSSKLLTRPEHNTNLPNPLTASVSITMPAIQMKKRSASAFNLTIQ